MLSFLWKITSFQLLVMIFIFSDLGSKEQI